MTRQGIMTPSILIIKHQTDGKVLARARGDCFLACFRGCASVSGAVNWHKPPERRQAMRNNTVFSRKFNDLKVLEAGLKDDLGVRPYIEPYYNELQTVLGEAED